MTQDHKTISFVFLRAQTYNLLPPPESSKSRQAKQQKSEEVTQHVSTIETTSVETTTKAKTRPVKEDDWLHSSSVSTKAMPSNPINNIDAKIVTNTIETKPTFASENVLADDSVALQTPLAPPPTVTQFVDAFSDLDPLGTGKFRPYIDKKYFFQDLKNPPKKVLKDLTDRDSGFSVSFSAGGANSGVGEFTQFQDNSSFETTPKQLADAELRRTSDANDEFNAQFATDTQIFSPNNNGTHGTPPSLARAPSNVFTTTFHGATQCAGEPNITSSKSEKTDEANANYAQYLVMDNDPFSPRAKKYDVFEDDFSKKSINAFDFSFNKNAKPANDLRNNNEEPARVGERKANETAMLNGSKYDSISKRHGSDSMSESEIAPDPPPRPETSMPSDPPPLPPKKQLSDFQVKRPVSHHSYFYLYLL